MTRIKDLGEACDQAIETLSELMKGEVVGSHQELHVRRQAAIDTLHAYFMYSNQPAPDTK